MILEMESNRMTSDDFGKYIKALRKVRRMNSTKLSKLIGKSSAYISHLENGRYKNPDYETACRILKLLGVSEEEIEPQLRKFHLYTSEYLTSEIENFKTQPIQLKRKACDKIKIDYIKQDDYLDLMSKIQQDAKDIALELKDLNVATKKYLIEILQQQINS
ncbi:helix-turn-helix transcriptional regulator [Heyndrickxia oleronia]|uniref:helix-turn-helix domain-containing protein n=1 Tax=Heyndrickxia oleronia TaxID=38875 RepID=UPI003F2486A9